MRSIGDDERVLRQRTKKRMPVWREFGSTEDSRLGYDLGKI